MEDLRGRDWPIENKEIGPELFDSLEVISARMEESDLPFGLLLLGVGAEEVAYCHNPQVIAEARAAVRQAFADLHYPETKEPEEPREPWQTDASEAWKPAEPEEPEPPELNWTPSYPVWLVATFEMAPAVSWNGFEHVFDEAVVEKQNRFEMEIADACFALSDRWVPAGIAQLVSGPDDEAPTPQTVKTRFYFRVPQNPDERTALEEYFYGSPE